MWSERLLGSILVLFVQLLRKFDTKKKSSLEAVNGVNQILVNVFMKRRKIRKESLKFTVRMWKRTTFRNSGAAKNFQRGGGRPS